MTTRVVRDLDMNISHEWEPLPSKLLTARALDGEEPVQIISG